MEIDWKTNQDEIIQALKSGDIRTCSRLISHIELDRHDLVMLLQALYKAGGHSHIIGITGPPGAGKSTLINKLIKNWRKRGKRVAVLAIDPSSPFSGGAILGDRLRMTEHYSDDGVFIRSIAARGQLGGLAKVAGDAITVLDAMPWDIIIVETVGVGQNETDIMRHASVVVLLQTPMAGDDVQAAKAGINEIGDIYVVNKSDHPDAERTFRQLEEMIALDHHLHPNQTWIPPVIKTQSLLGEGINELVDNIERRFINFDENPDETRQKQRDKIKYRISEILHSMLDKRINLNDKNLFENLIDPVTMRVTDPYAIAKNFLDKILPEQS